MKIGRSRDARGRIKQLRGLHPVDNIEILAIIDDDIEQELHQRFGHCRRKGEWFQRTDEIEEYVREVGVSKDPVEVILEDWFWRSGEPTSISYRDLRDRTNKKHINQDRVTDIVRDLGGHHWYRNRIGWFRIP